MKRRRRTHGFDKFPEPPVTDAEVLNDTRNMDYLSKFRDWHVTTVFYLALLGMTDEQMAHVFQISIVTFNNWKSRHPTFLKSVREGKEQADAKVVYSLYQAALGYTHPSEQIISNRVKEYDSVTGKVVSEHTEALRVPITKQYPPNVKAAIRWLEIRQPEQWAPQRKEVASSITMTHRLDLTDFTVEELQVLSRLGVADAGVKALDVPFAATTDAGDTKVEKLD